MEIIYGVNTVLEALRAGSRRVNRLLISRGIKTPRVKEIEDLAEALGIAVQRDVPDRLSRITGGGVHQGVVAWVEPLRFSTLDEIVGLNGRERGPILVPEGIQDPHNLGAIIRTAAICGVAGVILEKRRTAPLTPVVSKVACGAIEHIRLVQVANIPRMLLELKERGFLVLGMDEKGALPITNVDLPARLVVVIGSEGRGIRPVVRRKCDLLTFIPSVGPIKTFNASVATGIILYEIRRRSMAKK